MISLAYSFPLPQLSCCHLGLGHGRKVNVVKNTLQNENISTSVLKSTNNDDHPLMSKMASKEEQEEHMPRSTLGVKVVNPKPRNGLISRIIDNIETLTFEFMGNNSSMPNHFLSGNFAPLIHETPPTQDLQVFGRLPECLNGQVFRIGPNPKFQPLAGYHWFDGDGMVHGLQIRDGKATYVSRYVKTSRLMQEMSFGCPKFHKLGDFKGLCGLFTIVIQSLRERCKVIDTSYGVGTGNTALTYHHGNLLALHETDKPYILKIHNDGDIETIGLLDFDERFGCSFTAHPKIDPITGEMFVFGYSVTESYINYTIISKDGFMHEPVQLRISEPVMMHDFAITESYAIIMDQTLSFKPKELLKKNKPIIAHDPTKIARFGVVPRYPKNGCSVTWFELPDCYILHTANAWEEDDTIVLIGCHHENPLYVVDLEKLVCTSCLYELRFNMTTGKASQKKLSTSPVEFPKVNEIYIGRKQRYVYGAIINDMMKITGLVKFDLNCEPKIEKQVLETKGNIEGIFYLESAQFGSEVVFIPRCNPARSKDITTQEDDGYLVLFAHDENKGNSSVIVIDAKTMSQDPVAVVELPNRVPYGFHSLFVTEEQLQQQRSMVPNE